MHKDLNVVKEGDSAMREEWKNHIISPIILTNKNNAAILKLTDMKDEEILNSIESRCESATERWACEVFKAEDCKTVSLIEAMFNNKNDKRD